MDKEFPVIESKLSKYANISIKILFYTSFLGVPLFTSLFLFWIGANNPGLLVMIFFGMLLIFFKARLDDKKSGIKRIKINKEGAFYYNDDDVLVDKVLYADLCTSGNTYDIGINLERKYKRSKEIIVFTKESSVSNRNQRGVYFHLEAANVNLQKLNSLKSIDINPLWNDISNEGELQNHFVRGIQTHRPDLKIDPLILKLFRL